MSSRLQFKGDRKLCSTMKNRGGKIFCDALNKSLCIGKEFEKTVAKNCYNSAPIVVRPKVEQFQNRALPGQGVQKAINWYNSGCIASSRVSDPKDVGLKSGPSNANLAIDKFFCLPSFDRQTSEIFVAAPAGVKDQESFLFVDLKK